MVQVQSQSQPFLGQNNIIRAKRARFNWWWWFWWWMVL